MERGGEQGDRVVVRLERGADAAAAYFGVLAGGGVVVMLNEALRQRQIEYVLEHSGAKLLLTSHALPPRHHRPLGPGPGGGLAEATAREAASAPPERGGVPGYCAIAPLERRADAAAGSFYGDAAVGHVVVVSVPLPPPAVHCAR
ncbi:AMP-binding protein, partial [Klebsiella pneumoniae]|uniref:AMP-binding protein n=1 Tax=Klebsiella pneumoniae TaxID=573 RepID=UPI0024088617